MYSFLRTLSPRRLLTEQAPVMVTSLLVAEVAFKFHSFVLEAAAFLATWYVLDGVRVWITSARRADRRCADPGRS